MSERGSRREPVVSDDTLRVGAVGVLKGNDRLAARDPEDGHGINVPAG